MRWSLTEEQEMLTDALQDWLDHDADSAHVRSMLGDAGPAAIESALADGGWSGIGVAEDDGGQGGGLTELCLLAEALAAHAAPSSAWLATALALPLLPAGDDALTAALEGGAIVALAARSDRPLDARPTVSADGGRLSGEVPLVLGGDRAGLLVVPGTGAGGTALHVVEADADGVAVEPLRLLDGGRTAATVRFDGAAARPLELEADAALARAALRGAVLVAADALGAATRLRELAVEYAGQRTQFGSPIGAFQAVKHAAATMLVDEEAARSLVHYAAEAVDVGAPDAALAAAAAKAQATAAAARSADAALTLHGAIGYTWEHDLQLFYKRTKLDLSLFGTPAVWNERIAEGLDLR